MPTEQPPAPAPTLTNVGLRPATPHKLFVNLPVRDLQASIRFFEALGFTFNAQFTDGHGTCMLVGEDAYVMLATRERFASFIDGKPTSEPRQGVTAIFSISVDSREAVDTMVRTAGAHGAEMQAAPTDHGFMYDWGFYDLDGHPWGVFWMDPAMVVQG